MTSIGILTRHCYPNYGSLLQTYALQSALNRLGATVRVIDYIPYGETTVRLAQSNLRDSRMRKRLSTRALYYAVQGPNFAVMNVRFRRYQRSTLQLTEHVGSSADLAEVARQLDAVVVGSDQVWSRIYGRIDPNYYLSGVSDAAKKYSYAASFGSTDPPPEDGAQIRRWLSAYDVISVREPSAVRELGNLGLDARHDVDPVLLHGRDFWTHFASRERAVDHPYLLVYQIHNTPAFNERLREARRRHALPVRRVTIDGKQFFRRNASDYLATPARFVQLFRNASVVITDSFHGTAFSLLFGRPLYSLLPQKNAARSHDLLTSVGVGKLAVPAGAPLPGDPNYDTASVGNVLATTAERSWQYLRTIVEST